MAPKKVDKLITLKVDKLITLWRPKGGQTNITLYIYVYICMYAVESKLGPKIAFFESKLGPFFLCFFVFCFSKIFFFLQGE